MAIYSGEFETKFITYLKFSGDHSEYMVQFSPETMNHTYVLYLLYYVVYYFLQRILLISQVFIYSIFQVRSFLHCGRSGTNLASLYRNYLPCARNNYT